MPDGLLKGTRRSAAASGRCGTCAAIPISRRGTPPPRFRGGQELWWPTQRAFRPGAAAAPWALERLPANAGDSVTLLAQAERFL